MPPAFYHRAPVCMEKPCQEEALPRRLKRLACRVLAGLVFLALTITVIVLGIRVNSEPCQNGLQAQRKCRNATYLLHSQLSRVQDVLLEAENQAHACNQTVVALNAALRKKTSDFLELQARTAELERNNEMLNEKLEELRKEEALSLENGTSPAASSLPVLWVALVAGLLFLGPGW